MAARWRRYWPDADADAIAVDVHGRLQAAVDAWELPLPEPLPGGVVALTCAAGDAVVKVLPRHHREEAVMRGEGVALGHWRETGAAVALLDSRDGGMTLLVERLRPAGDLDRLAYDEQLVAAGRIVARLHAAGSPPDDLPSIEAYVEPYRRIAEVRADLDALLVDAPTPVCAHADLHGGNVLRDGERWVAIDPKGVHGDPHLDVWLLVCPQAPPLPEVKARNEMRRRIAVYADAAGLDPERAGRWVSVIARAEAVLSADSAFSGWPLRLARVAKALG